MEDTRRQIIASASERFRKFGYGKTSMAEIARDCAMSAGNLYRYFKSKTDIAESIARSGFEDTVEELQGILRSPGLTAAQRVEEFFLQEMYFTYRQLQEYPTLIEQAEDLRSSRPLLFNDYLAASRAVLAEVLGMGNNTGEFAIEDVVETAEMMQSATMKFRYPQVHSSLTLEKLEREAKGVTQLILYGITCKESGSK